MFLKKQFVDVQQNGKKEIKKKFLLLLKYFFSFPVYLYGFIICCLFFFLKPIITIRVQRLPTENFGDFLIFTGLYYIKKKILKKKEHNAIDLIFIDQKKIPVNKTIYKIFSKKITFFPEILIKPIFEVSKALPIFNTLLIPIFSTRLEYDENNLFEKFQILELNEHEKQKGEKLLKDYYGIDSDAKIAFLAVRDSEFTKFKSSKINTNLEHNSFRDFDISNFYKACDFLTKKGFYVFRMGRKAEKKFGLNNPRIIDYATSNAKNDFLDVYIAYRCDLCISTSFGLDALPYVFGKPMAITTTPVGDFRGHSKRIFLTTRRHYHLDLKRDLSLKEIFDKKLAFITKDTEFKNANIDLIEPSESEIGYFIEEFYEKIYLRNSISEDEKRLQEKFKTLFKEFFKNTNYTLNKKKYYKNLHSNFSSLFSFSFLEKNKNWLN